MPESHEDTTSGAAMHCVVVTPEATILDEPADFVALQLYDGEIGIGPNHSPMLGRLGFGEMRIKQGGQSRRYYVEGGFVEVIDNVVSVMTNRADLADAIQADVAEELLATALGRPAHGTEQMEIRDRNVAQARAQVRIARRGAS